MFFPINRLNRWIVLGLISLNGLSTGCGKIEFPSALPVYGTWKPAHPMRVEDLSLMIALKVEAGKLTSTSTCTLGNTVTSTSVSVSDVVTGTSIITMEAKRSLGTDPSLRCETGIEKGALNYTIKGNQLTVRNSSVDTDAAIELVRQ